MMRLLLAFCAGIIVACAGMAVLAYGVTWALQHADDDLEDAA